MPFDDNLSERDLRIFKNKTKISGGFRSINVAQNFADALSIIKTSIKRNINPFESIHNIFSLTFSFSLHMPHARKYISDAQFLLDFHMPPLLPYTLS